MKPSALAFAFVLTALSLTAPAFAAVDLNLTVVKEQRIQAKDGSVSVKLIPAQSAVPGDRLVYTLRYRNTGKTPAADLVLNYPLPQGVLYRAPADGSTAPDVSVDGKTFAPLGGIMIGNRPATAEDVTHLRWALKAPVAAGGSGQVAFSAVLQ